MLRIAFLLTVLLTLGACAAYQPYDQRSSSTDYVVQPGDNLYSIAFALETTPEALQNANLWMQPDRLKPGMRLKLPGTADTATASAPANPPEYTANSGPVAADGFIWPLPSFNVSSYFGPRRGRLHAGIDLRAPQGTPIRAAADGRVAFAGHSGGYGRMVVIDHGRGVETVYAHNSRNLVQRGQRVKKGEIIGRVGRSGNATGNHVHFEFRRNGRPLDPLRHMRAGL